jgi:hypothetical protein
LHGFMLSKGRTAQRLPTNVPFVGTPGADPDLGSAHPLTAGLSGSRGNPSFAMGALSWDERPPITEGDYRRIVAD